jgi:hypothetical protein
MEDLVASTKNIKPMRNPSLRNLYDVRNANKGLFRISYPCRIHCSACEIGRSRPAHPRQWHNLLLLFPADNYSMNNENKRAKAKAYIKESTPLPGF